MTGEPIVRAGVVVEVEDEVLPDDYWGKNLLLGQAHCAALESCASAQPIL
jgi:hypothetical protein